MLRAAVAAAAVALLLSSPRACLAAPPPAPTPDPAAAGRHAVVLGAGFSGLTAALELRALGYAVTVLDRLPAPGGRAQRLHEPGGYAFDTGPSWYWMPEVFDTVFARYGIARERHYNLTRLDPAYRLLLPPPAPGAPPPPPLDVPGTLPDFLAMADALDPANALRAFLADAEAKYRLGVDSAIWQAPGFPLAPWMLSRAVHPNLVLRNLRQHIAAYTSHPTLRAVLEWPSQFLGMDAGATPSLYALLSWSGHAQGTWLPSRGGMAAPAVALHAEAVARGVRFEFCTEVTGLQAAGRYVVTRVGSRPSGACPGAGAAPAATTTWRAVDAVVASGDYEFIEQTLLPASLRRHSPQYWAAVAMTPNVITFRLCVTAPVPVLTHAHTLLLEDAELPFYASSYGTVEAGEGEGEGAGAPPPPPRRSGTSVFVLVPLLNASAPTPPHDAILARVLARLRLTPADLACGAGGYGPANYSADYHAFRGNAFGLANTLGQTMWLKPPMQSLAVNLVFAGHLTHPGPGVPPALVSGIVAARALHGALAPPPTLRELALPLLALALLLALGAAAHTPAAAAALALHRGGKTYFAAACAMPYANFAAIARLYAVLREADDLVDCTHADAATRAADIAACEARVLATPASRLGHAPALWTAFFAAMRADTAPGGTACATLAELTAYMDGSAAVLGEFLLPALGGGAPGGASALTPPARALGYAFQLTNMLRDVVEDGGLGRRYVPADAVVAAGFAHGDPAAAAAHPADPRFHALMERMFSVADAWYAAADAGIAALPPHTRPAIALARTSYHRLHDGIRAAGYALVPRVVVPWWRKLADATALLPASGIVSIVGGEVAARVLGGAALGALPAAALLALALALARARPPRHHEVTYAEVHCMWTLPLLAALAACAAALRFAWRGRAAYTAYSGHASDAAMSLKWAALLAGVAYAYTTPWDAHLIARGVWASSAVAGAALGVPLEELAFFGLAAGVGVGAWLCVWPLRWADVAGAGPGAGAGAAAGAAARAGAPGAGAALAALGAAGLALAAYGPSRAYYLGALLAWACPVLALQVWVGGGVLWAQRGSLARAVALSGGALAMVDAWAIHRNVWVLSPSYTLPAWGAGWHVEEVAFFFLTASMCCGGLTLALWAEHGFLPRMRLAGVEVAWGARAAGKGGKAE